MRKLILHSVVGVSSGGWFKFSRGRYGLLTLAWNYLLQIRLVFTRRFTQLDETKKGWLILSQQYSKKKKIRFEDRTVMRKTLLSLRNFSTIETISCFYLFKGVIKLLAVIKKFPLFALELFFNLLQLTLKLFLAKTKEVKLYRPEFWFFW